MWSLACRIERLPGREENRGHASGRFSRSEISEIVPQCFVSVSGTSEPPALKGGNQTVRNLDDVAAADAQDWGGDQETIAADLLHYLPHAIGDLIWRAYQLHRRDEAARASHDQFAQSLAAAPFLKLVERALLAIGDQFFRQGSVGIKLREVDLGDG